MHPLLCLDNIFDNIKRSKTFQSVPKRKSENR